MTLEAASKKDAEECWRRASVLVHLSVFPSVCQGACVRALWLSGDLAVSEFQVMTGWCAFLLNSLLFGMPYALLCAAASAMVHGRYCCAVGRTTHG